MNKKKYDGQKNTGHIIEFWKNISLFIFICESIIILFSYNIIFFINENEYNNEKILLLIIIIFIYTFFSFSKKMYGSIRLLNFKKIINNLIVIDLCTMLTISLMIYVGLFSSEIRYMAVSQSLILSFLILLTFRFLVIISLRHIRIIGFNAKSYVIIGNKELSTALHNQINNMPWSGMNLSGVFLNLNELKLHIIKKRPDYIFITLPENSLSEINKIILELINSTSSIYLWPATEYSKINKIPTAKFGELSIVPISDHRLYGLNRIIKRLTDFILSIVILLIISPIIIIISLLIKIDSKGPVFFKQKRYGIHGRPFDIYKFRTMAPFDQNYKIVDQVKKDDPRVTRFGRFLRRTSLDELPQFFNTLMGDMSIVGPRPHPIALDMHYINLVDKYMQRNKVKPGITGWAQVHNLRGETDTIDKMELRVSYDIFYINNWSMLLDIKIIIMTLVHCIYGKNAY